MTDTFTADLPSVEDAAAMGTDTGTPAEPVVEAVAADSGFDAEPAAPEASPELYTVKVGGEEQQVTLEDLQQGFMRQADYTRKTQEVAEQRRALAQAEALAEALDRDPQRTLQLLAEAYGTPVQGQETTPFEEMDPLEQRLHQVEQQLTRAQQAEINRQIDSDIAQLKATYGESVDVDATVAHAVKHRISLDLAYKDLHWEKAQADQRAVQAKRAAQVVQGAGTVQRAAVSAPPKAYGSIREAALAALKQHQVI